MQLATITGHATATVKHPSLAGWRLLLAQPDGTAEEPLLVIDALGAGVGSRVVISNDGKGARELVKESNSPVRWFTLAMLDA